MNPVRTLNKTTVYKRLTIKMLNTINYKIYKEF